MFDAYGGTAGYLSSAVVCTEMVSYLPGRMSASLHGPRCSLEINKSVVSSVLLSAMTIQNAQSTLLPTMLYTHNCTGIINPQKGKAQT